MNERETFAAALLRSDPAERAAFLDEACGQDSAARRRIEQLLALHEHDILMLDRSPWGSRERRGENEARDDVPSAAAAVAPLTPFLAPSERPDALGRLGHYDVLEVLGHGGFGIVVRAFDDRLHRVVAIKFLAPHLGLTSPPRKRFLREARAAAQVKHENVVQIYAVEEQPLPYLVMEFVDGVTLQQRLDGGGPLDAAEVIRLGRQIALGLSAAHAKGLVHRDVKPANILLETGVEGRAKLTDFGLARAGHDASLTHSGVLAGTPVFMAPEQATGAALDHRADLFSLGSVLYTMVAGYPPFRAPNTPAVLRRVVEDTPRPLSDIIPEVPPWLCDIVAKLHAKNPADRFQSAREVADLLADGETRWKAKQIASVELPRASQARHPERRWKWIASTAGIGLVLALLAVSEFAGVTQLFRAAPVRLESKPSGPHPSAADLSDIPGVQAADPGSLPRDQSPVQGSIANPGVHDDWITGLSQLPTADFTTALTAKLKERNTDFDDAFRRSIPSLPAERQLVMAQAWLRERQPAFAGFEDTWKKTIPQLSAETQLILVLPWLKECNPAFDNVFQHTITDGRLTSLEVPSPLLQDLTPLQTLTTLKSFVGRSTLGYDNQRQRDAQVLRSLTSLETINGKPVDQFWREADSKQAEFDQWLQRVPTLAEQEQVAEVIRMLKERNPGFDGTLQHRIEDGGIVELGIQGQPVTDLSPLRGLARLKSLNCDKCPLSDLSPIRELPLESFHGERTFVVDLSPLRAMPLKSLRMAFARELTDLKPLQGMKLEYLGIQSTRVSDLTPLQGMPLKSLDMAWTRGVTDLKPLRGMPLEYLNLSDLPISDLSEIRGMTSLRFLILQEMPISDLSALQGLPVERLYLRGSAKVSDLTPIQEMPLWDLTIHGTGVTDLTPLKGMQLKMFRLTPRNITHGLEIIRGMTSIETIGSGDTESRPAAEFWKEFEAR